MIYIYIDSIGCVQIGANNHVFTNDRYQSWIATPPKKLINDGLKIGVFWFPRANFTTAKVGSQGCNIKFIRQDSGAKAGGVIF